MKKKKTLPTEQALTQRLLGKKKRVWSGTAEPLIHRPGEETFSSGVPAEHWLLVSLKH